MSTLAVHPLFCACGFEGWEFGLWTARWHRAHITRHLEVFPGVDVVTRANLEDAARFAEARKVASTP